MLVNLLGTEYSSSSLYLCHEAWQHVGVADLQRFSKQH